jgi:hypothetical protein
MVEAGIGPFPEIFSPGRCMGKINAGRELRPAFIM